MDSRRLVNTSRLDLKWFVLNIVSCNLAFSSALVSCQLNLDARRCEGRNAERWETDAAEMAHLAANC